MWVDLKFYSYPTYRILLTKSFLYEIQLICQKSTRPVWRPSVFKKTPTFSCGETGFVAF